MRKIVKIIALAVIVVLMSLSLCSCDMLDDLRNKQAFWTDESQNEFVYQGEKYIKVEHSGRDLIFTGEYIDINITNNDVPVMLSESYEFSTSAQYIDSLKIARDGYQVFTTEENYEFLKDVTWNASKALTYFGTYIYNMTDGYYVDRGFVVSPEAIGDIIEKYALKLKTNAGGVFVTGFYSDTVIFYHCDKDGVLAYANGYYICEMNNKLYMCETNALASAEGYELVELESDDAKAMAEYLKAIQSDNVEMI